MSRGCSPRLWRWAIDVRITVADHQLTFTVTAPYRVLTRREQKQRAAQLVVAEAVQITKEAAQP